MIFFTTVAVAIFLGLLVSNGLRIGGRSGTGGNSGSGVPTAAGGIPGKVDPGLVDVVSTIGYKQAEAAGTGLVLTPSGEVLTNNHVISGATSIVVTDIGNGRSYPATVVGYDIGADIAVLQLRGASGLKVVQLGDSSKVRVGQKVTALGNAGGVGGTPSVASGSVTGLDQMITATDQSSSAEEHLAGLISTNAKLQPGDSGGPLVNAMGKVIGLDTAASSGYQFAQGGGQGFAIPVNRAVSVSRQIEGHMSSAAVHIGPTAFMGVELEWQGSSGNRAVVAGVVPGLPAAKAGMAPNDVLMSVGGRPASSPEEVQNVLERLHPGDRVNVSWNDQSGARHSASLVLASGPAG
jgi:S1-C subfamily serine protease